MGDIPSDGRVRWRVDGASLVSAAILDAVMDEILGGLETKPCTSEQSVRLSIDKERMD
jgi:hypothetical protein